MYTHTHKHTHIYYIHRSFSVTRRVTPNIHHGTMVHPPQVMLMLQQLIADAKAMEVESSTAEREAQKDYEAFGKARQKKAEVVGEIYQEQFFFFGELLWIACVYIYMYTYFYVMCYFVIISTFIYLFISFFSYFVLSYSAGQVICDRKCLSWSWIWIPHGDGSKFFRRTCRLQRFVARWRIQKKSVCNGLTHFFTLW